MVNQWIFKNTESQKLKTFISVSTSSNQVESINESRNGWTIVVIDKETKTMVHTEWNLIVRGRLRLNSCIRMDRHRQHGQGYERELDEHGDRAGPLDLHRNNSNKVRTGADG